MSRRITRRRFLEATLAVVCAGGGIVWWRRHQRIRARIRNHFPYLRLESGAVRRFLSEYQKANGLGSLETAGHSRLAMQFLLSTDFFHHDGDESRAIRYSRLADPYANPCYNPLARYV
jgi:hypothetical protein